VTLWRKRIACWITKATNKHSEYVTLLAFPLQQRLQESPSVLRKQPVLFINKPVSKADHVASQDNGQLICDAGHVRTVPYVFMQILIKTAIKLMNQSRGYYF